MPSRAMRVSTACARVVVRMIVRMIVVGLVLVGFRPRPRPRFGVRNVNGVLVLMVTVVALHIDFSVRADQHFDMLADASRQCTEGIAAF